MGMNLLPPGLGAKLQLVPGRPQGRPALASISWISHQAEGFEILIGDRLNQREEARAHHVLPDPAGCRRSGRIRRAAAPVCALGSLFM
jgi:hypothetical protein